MDRSYNRGAAARLGTLMVIGVVALVLLGIVMSSWRSIRPGYVGIVFDKFSHKVTTGALEPGWAFINPFTQAIQEYPVTIQTYSMVQKGTEGQVEGDDSIKIQSSEGQQLNLDVVIQYQVLRNEAGQLYEDWGGADITIVEDRVVRQYTRSQVPVMAAQYGWEEIAASKRGELAELIAQQLAEEFGRRHLELISFGIREVHLPANLQSALDNKIQAQQAAEQQEYQLQQARVKAEQDQVEAEGRANALKAQADGEARALAVRTEAEASALRIRVAAEAESEANAVTIRAEAQAKANELLAQSLTPELIRYQQLQRWDGRLPVFQGSDVNPLIDVSSLVPAPSTVPAPAPSP